MMMLLFLWCSMNVEEADSYYQWHHNGQSLPQSLLFFIITRYRTNRRTTLLCLPPANTGIQVNAHHYHSGITCQAENLFWRWSMMMTVGWTWFSRKKTKLFSIERIENNILLSTTSYFHSNKNRSRPPKLLHFNLD